MTGVRARDGTPIVVVGTGGMGREAVTWLQDAEPDALIEGFLDRDPSLRGREFSGLPVLGEISWIQDRAVQVVVAIGSPPARRDIVRSLREQGVQLRSVVHPSATIGARSTVGPGSIVCPNVTITVDVEIAEAVIVNYGAQIGHDCRVGPYAFIAPGVNLAGNVTIEEGADVGIGASAIQGVTIGAWSRVGGGAVVINDVPAGATVVGVPARPLGNQGGT